MKKMKNVLVALMVLFVTNIYAQIDWGTDGGSELIIGPVSGVVDSFGENALIMGGTTIQDTVRDTTTVSDVYNLGLMTLKSDASTGIDDTIWSYYHIVNEGNAVDSISITTDTLSPADFGEVLIVEDRDFDSLWSGTPVDSILSTTGTHNIGLAEDASMVVLIGIVVPAGAMDGDQATLTIVINGNLKSGTDDFWPINYPAAVGTDNGDSFLDSVAVTVGFPIIFFNSYVDKPTAVPGETLLYTLEYDNDGTQATNTADGAGGLVVRQVLPEFGNYVASSLDTTLLHTTSFAVMFSSEISPGTFDKTYILFILLSFFCTSFLLVIFPLPLGKFPVYFFLYKIPCIKII